MIRMASFHPIFQHPRGPVESPAKVFAKLKSRVQRDADEALDLEKESRAAEIHGGGLCTPKKRTDILDMTRDLGLHQRFDVGEVTAVTLSPISSPLKSHNFRPVDELSGFMQLDHAFKQRRGAFLESTAVCNTATTQSDDHRVCCEPRGLKEGAGHPRLKSHGSVLSPMKNRVGKRKWEEQDLSKGNCMSSKVGYAFGLAKERKMSSAACEDYVASTKGVQACPQPQELKEAPAHTGCVVEMPPPNLFSPAKMFAYLKERENLREQCDHVQYTTPRRRIPVNLNDQREPPVQMDSAASSGKESSDSEKDQACEAEPVPVLFEDPVVLNTPSFNIPKTKGPAFKRAKWPQGSSFPTENVIHLRKWFLRKSQKGLFIVGIHREKNVTWNSNIVTDRVSNTVLKTVSGRVYILVGKLDVAGRTQFPKWFLKHFANGFPANWKELYEKYLLHGKFNESFEPQKEKRTHRPKSSMNESVNQQRQKTLKTPESCPSSTQSAQVSRSGRLIKPPLEYWMGGRVMLDADMNVTIYECYNTSVIQPTITTTVSTKPARKPAVVSSPETDVCEQHESITQSQPLRKARAPQRNQHRPRADIGEKPLSPKNISPARRAPKPCPVMEKTGKKHEETKSKNSKKDTRKRRGDRQGRVVKSAESSTSSFSSPSPTSTERTKALKKKSEKPNDKKCPMELRSRSGRSSDSHEEGVTLAQKPQRKQSKEKAQQKPRSKTPKPVRKTSPVYTKPREPQKASTKLTRDEDEWGEEELRRLQEAVSCYPKHIASYWTKVAKMVRTRTAEECHKRHTSMGAPKTPTKQEGKTKKKKEASKETGQAVISARVGTLRRKRQEREFLDNMPKDDMDDVFSSEYMRNKRFEMPSMCGSEEQDIALSDLEPLTPRSSVFPEAKTPQCQLVTPGMMGSASRNCDDKYIFHLQKRMKNRYQFNVHKHAPKSFSPTASVKKTIRLGANQGNDLFVVREMFPEKDEVQTDSDEEDFYFSEND